MEVAKIRYYFRSTNLVFKSFTFRIQNINLISNIINLLTPKNLAFVTNKLILQKDIYFT